MRRRQSAIPRLAAGRKTALPSDPRPSNAAARMRRPLGLTLQPAIAAGVFLDASLVVPVPRRPWPVRT